MTPGDERSAMQWALMAIGRRMHTTHEISAGLSKRGFADEVVGKVVRELVRAGYLNDLDFARTWVTSRSVHQMHGRLRLLRDLKQKGVPDEISGPVLEESFPHEDEVDIAIKAAEKKRRSMRVAGKGAGLKGRAALYRHLRSRGFTSRVISAALAGISFEEDSS